MRLRYKLFPFIILLLLTACSPLGAPSTGNGSTLTATKIPTRTPVALLTPASTADLCPAALGQSKSCYTPHALRVAYGIEALTEQGFTGKGQTVVDIVSFRSPTLHHDMDVFDRQFSLPPINVQVAATLGTPPFNPKKNDPVGSALETKI